MVNVTTNSAPSSNLTVRDLGSGSVLLLFDGIPARSYAIQFATNLANPSWETLTNTTANLVGAFGYTDTPPPGITRTYRSTPTQ